MKRTMISLVVVLAFASFVSGAWACPGEGKSSCAKVQTVAHPETDKPTCGDHAATKVADAKSSCCGSDGKGCCESGGKSCCGSCPKSCCGSCGGSRSGACGQSCDKPCGQKSTTLTSGKAGCSAGRTVAAGPNVDAVLTSFPSMTYRVGDTATHCSLQAETIARKTGQPIHYAVGDRTFNNQGEAKLKLASLLEKEIDTLKTVQYVAGGECHHCPRTAKKIAEANGDKVAYRVAGFDFQCRDKAESVAKLVSDRLAEVKMSYKVGDDSFCCDKMAARTAQKTGNPVHYVVDGEETSCEKTAKLMLSEAMIRAAVLTAAAAFAS